MERVRRHDPLTFVGGMSGQEPWAPWANDPESFERAVLAGLEQRLSGSVSATVMRIFGREFRGARVDGSYPDTTIVVSYDLRTGGVEEERVSVWGDFREGPGETMLDPESLAEEIWIWLLP